MRILAISGSLRAASLNSALLRAVARLAPPDIEVEVTASIAALPLFNPDLEPVALLNASPRATHAQAALRETLITMSASLVDEACIAVPLLGSGLDEDGIVHHPAIASALSGALRALRNAVGLRPL